MKKLIIVLAQLLLFSNIASATSIFATEDEWASIVEWEDWSGLIDEYFLRELFNDDAALLYFAQELNISNGFREKWGERYMFGRLESINSLREPHTYSQDMIEYIGLEVRRLLFGPWLPPGSTSFARATPKEGRYRALTATGEWVSLRAKDIALLLKVTHKTDHYANTRYAYLAIVHLGTNESMLGLEEYRVYLVRQPNI